MNPFAALGIAAAVATVGLAYKTVAEVLRLRRRLRAPRRTAADAVDGERCRLVGVVGPGTALTAPLTGRACAAYIAEVADDAVDGAGTLRARGGVDFIVTDASGQVIVDPAGAELELEPPTHAWLRALGEAAPALDLAFVRARGGSIDAWRPGMRVRCRELIVAVGDRVAVIGHATRELDPDGARRATGYRDPLPTRVRFVASPGRPLIVTDRADLTAG